MSTALYRRYRPETFADVIGQEHVTEPLMQALRTNRVNHAYLFSGPRGCGKTTSARILARCLNCEHGPTPTPCGTCASCRDLARGGGGSLDVVEIDAASHGGVEDARDLRERASFAPARDRFKVYIIDEAHMVSTAGFNALLKLVEEPPQHVMFVFATTEPDKVIGTIRSRTHHYPFRLVPPERLQTYLGHLCRLEDVEVGKGVLPLVVRAGAGSVRDSLSVLDQLIAGSGPGGLSYEGTVSLLGYTHATMLDDTVEALAAGDGAIVFRVVDRVIESGQDPRRFVEDLLERLRDLIVVAAVPDDVQAVLRGVPEDQIDRMRVQASHFGAAELSRAADVVNVALTEMVGATSPRLHLELLCARLLLPGAEDTERGLRARLDRLERRVGVAGGPPVQAAPAAPAPAPAPAGRPAPAAPPAPAEPSTGVERQHSDADPEPAGRPDPSGHRDPGAAAPDGQPAQEAGDGPPQRTETVRRMWPDVLTRLGELNRGAWTMVSMNAKVIDVVGDQLRLGFDTAGQARTFASSAKITFVQQALIDVLGFDVQIEAVAGDPPAVPAGRPQRAGRPQPAERPRPASDGWAADGTGSDATAPGAPGPGARPGPEPARPPGAADDEPLPGAGHDLPPPRDEDLPPQEDDPPPDLGRPAARQEGTAARASAPAVAPEHDEPSTDDPDAEDSGLVGPAVVAQILGGRVIDEVDDRR